MSIQDTICAAHRSAQAAVGCTITYSRGLVSVPLDARIGDTQFETDAEFGPAIETESRDYLIEVADLILDDAVTLPVSGDQIRETVDSTTFVYEVSAFGNEPCFRYSDDFHQLLRIHTKLVATE